jgi:hypothetical protein
MGRANLLEKFEKFLEQEDAREQSSDLIQHVESTDLRFFHKKMAEASMKKVKESIQKTIGIDPSVFPWREGANLSIRSIRENVEREASTFAKMLEGAVSFSSFGQLLRYGVQNFMFDRYLQVPVVYPDVVAVRPSKNTFEWYAPLYRAEMPTDVPAGGRLSESRLVGLDVILQNKWVGRILAIDRQLVDDDQTGQIVTKASQLGEMVRYKEELDVMGAIRLGGLNSANTQNPMGYSAGIGNAFSSNQTLSQPNLETAHINLSTIKDPLGNFMLVMPDLLLVGSGNQFVGAKLLNSTLQPSVPGSSGQTASTASSGLTGWTMTINPLQGLYSLKWSRFLNTNEWYLMQSKTSIVFQDRLPLEVSQEVPLSGQSFEQNIYRWRSVRRYNTVVIESRFIFQGSST